MDEGKITFSNATIAVPVGTIIWFAGTTPPDGYLECNGSVISEATYPVLYALLGTTFDPDNIEVRLPNLRGEFIRGWDNTRGVDNGREFGSWQNATGILKRVVEGRGMHIDNEDGRDTNKTVNVKTGYNTSESNQYFRVRPRNVALLPCIRRDYSVTS